MKNLILGLFFLLTSSSSFSADIKNPPNGIFIAKCDFKVSLVVLSYNGFYFQGPPESLNNDIIQMIYNKILEEYKPVTRELCSRVFYANSFSIYKEIN